MIQKVRMSKLTRMASEKLAHAMSITDLRAMAELHDAIYNGVKPVSDYWEMEKDMLRKYGFNVKKSKVHSQGNYTQYRSRKQVFTPRQMAQIQRHGTTDEHRPLNVGVVKC